MGSFQDCSTAHRGHEPSSRRREEADLAARSISASFPWRLPAKVHRRWEHHRFRKPRWHVLDATTRIGHVIVNDPVSNVVARIRAGVYNEFLKE